MSMGDDDHLCNNGLDCSLTPTLHKKIFSWQARWLRVVSLENSNILFIGWAYWRLFINWVIVHRPSSLVLDFIKLFDLTTSVGIRSGIHCVEMPMRRKVTKFNSWDEIHSINKRERYIELVFVFIQMYYKKKYILYNIKLTFLIIWYFKDFRLYLFLGILFTHFLLNYIPLKPDLYEKSHNMYFRMTFLKFLAKIVLKIFYRKHVESIFFKFRYERWTIKSQSIIILSLLYTKSSTNWNYV